jgi:hypothetical protein
VRIRRFEEVNKPELLQLVNSPANGRATAAYKRMGFIRLVLVFLEIKGAEPLLGSEF